MNKKRIYATILLPLVLPLFMIGFLSVGLLSAQVETSILTMQGKDWSVRVDQNLQTETVLSQPYAVVTKQGQEKELFLQINDIKECASGIVEFKVAVSGLTFYKQLPLDQELKLDERIAFVNATHALDKEGNILTYRPSNVVNSFAGFDSQDRKQLHVYASKIIDTKGQEIWLDQDLANGLLTVYLPDQKTLEGLSFPLMLDPSFGYETLGGTDYYHDTGWMFTTAVTVPADADAATAITCGIKSDAYTITDKKIVYGLYANSSTLLGQSSAYTITNNSFNGWHTLDVDIDLSSYQSQEIYVAFAHETFVLIRGDSSGSGDSDIRQFSYSDTLPASWGTSGAPNTNLWSAYVNYTATGEPTPTPTPTPTATPTATPSPVSQETDSTLNLVILLCSLILGLLLIGWRKVPIVNLVFGIFMIGIASYTLTINLYAGGLLQLAVIIIGALCMYSGYREAM